jgi:hypothetical protein
VAPDHPATLDKEALTDLDRNLVDQNVHAFASPPTDVTIPNVQISELLLVYGERVILVPFVLAYSLNTNFDHGSEADLDWSINVQATDNASATATREAAVSAAREVGNNLVVAGLVAIVVLLTAGWLVWRGYLRHK